MTMNFRSLLSPEAQERLERFREREREHRGMSDSELAEAADYVFKNCTLPHAKWIRRGEPVYDSTMWHIIVPELIRRLRKGKGEP